jgi:hypothetical protein
VVRDCDIGYNKAYYSHSGGGVLVNGGQLLRCNVFKNEMDYGGGGGVFIDGGGVMTECNVWSNTLNGTFNNWVGYVGGGGVCVGNGTVSNSTIWGNWSYRGGGVEMANASAVLRNCLVMGNNAEWGVASYYGGGVRLDNGRVENCTVVRNTCGTGAGAGGGICRVAVGTATVTNSIFYHNSADDILNADTAGFGYSCASNGVTAGNNGNMTSEPKFVSAGSGSGQTAVLGDYRLQPSSPCVDKGAYLSWMNGATDRAGKKRIFRGVVDMGAFEDDTPRGTVICIR